MGLRSVEKESKDRVHKARPRRDAYRDLLENFKLGISIVQDGELVFVNQAISEMHGYYSKEAFTNEIGNFIAPEDFSRLIEIIDNLVAGKAVPKSLEYKAFRKDGSTFTADASAQLVEWNGRPAVLNTITDISDRKRAEASEIRLGRIVERSFNEVYTFDVETLYFVDANHGARLNLGYSLDELKTLKSIDIKPSIDTAAFSEITKPLVNGEQSKVVFETTHMRKDGSVYDVEVHLQMFTEEDPAVFVAIVQDITERKRAEADLLLAAQKSDEANRAKSEFLANMSHELRTPLNSVIGFAEVLSSQPISPLKKEKYQEYASEIRTSGKHLLSIVNDILDLSKIDAGKMELNEEPIDVRDVVHFCLSMTKLMAEEQGVTLTTEIAAPMPKLFADERLVKQMLLNLLSNAIKYSKPGGQVTVQAALAEDSSFNLSVSDTGIGIRSDDIQQALSPFGQVDGSFSRNRGGTGLGLPLVVSLVKLHGGNFTLNSEKDVGTTGTLNFPSDRVGRGASSAPQVLRRASTR
jgi:PAS domain S-box-containing protein